MLSAEELLSFASLLKNTLAPTALAPERQQELLLKGIVAALEESALSKAAVGTAALGGNGADQDQNPALDPIELLRETAARNPSQSVRTQALQAILRLSQETQPEAVDALYRLAVEQDSLAARQAILTHGWQPQRTALRALFDWFTQLQDNKPYPEEALPLLTRGYFEQASAELQRRLLATAAQVRAEDWARIISAVQTAGLGGLGQPLLELVDRYPSFRPVERTLVLEQLERLAGDESAAVRAAARDVLSLLFIRHEDPRARQVILRQGYLPEDPEQRALFFFLAENWAAYEALDFNHNLLINAYESAGRSLRRRLLEHSRHTGQIDWLRGLGTSGEVRWLNDLTDADWDLSIRRLSESEKYSELWRLAQVAPPIWSAVMLDRLAKSSWQPADEGEQHGLSSLSALARECITHPLAIHPQKALYAPIADITCLVVNPNGSILAAGSSDPRIIHLWNLPDGDLRLPSLIGPAPVTRAIAFSPEGDLLATASADNRIRAFRLAGGQLLKTLEGHRAMIRSMAIHPDGRTLYSAGFDGTIRFWRFPHGPELKTIQPGPDEIFSMVLGAGGSHLISAGADSLVRVWTLPEGSAARELSGHSGTVTLLAASPTSELVASAGRDGMIRLWNYASGGLIRTITIPGSPLTSLTLHPNDQVLIGGHNNGEINLWNLSTRRVIDRLTGHRKPITGLALSPQGDTLYTADTSGHLQVWDLRTFLTIRLPGEIARPGIVTELEEQAKRPNLLPAEKKWLLFTAELARWRQRFDIELAEFDTIQIGEFDIEL